MHRDADMSSLVDLTCMLLSTYSRMLAVYGTDKLPTIPGDGLLFFFSFFFSFCPPLCCLSRSYTGIVLAPHSVPLFRGGHSVNPPAVSIRIIVY